MPKVKVSEVSGIVLDWLVAECKGATDLRYDTIACWWFTLEGKNRVLSDGWSREQNWSPSNDPGCGWPIIDQEGIGLFCNRTTTVGALFKPDAGADWRAFPFNKHHEHHFGPTSLVAAMRCYVTSERGEEVEVPESLLLYRPRIVTK